ncbi:hypothetical protein SADUNF_Sadunf09G0032400 [Salix dunnii]|uniref:Uncharacterized protein n=1 Tax=Salix dunnii TaxID=1413687 RepID=A0A835JVG9_9ROSI|nr:hypothetical protein SADUNF_Sadunf09G0032400 [Salix dunnii]
MVHKRFQEIKTGIEYLKSVDYDKYLRKVGLGKEDHYFWKQIGKALLCTYTLIGAVWVYNETSPLGDEKAMEEFVAKGGMIGTTIGPKKTVETDKDSYNFQKQLQEKKFEQKEQKLWFRMRNERRETVGTRQSGALAGMQALHTIPFQAPGPEHNDSSETPTGSHQSILSNEHNDSSDKQILETCNKASGLDM